MRPAALAILLVGFAPHPARTGPKPERIVSLSLGTDEILCALVEPARIAALSSHAAEPEVSNVSEIARQIGVAVDRDAERVVALEPDLVVAARYAKLELQELMRKTSASVVVVSSFRSFEDIEENIATIGRAVGEPEKAAALIRDVRAKLGSVRVPDAGGERRVLYLAPTGWTAGRGTTIDELITRSGHVNAAAELGLEGHHRISSEQILASGAEVVVTGVGYARDEGFEERLASDPTLSILPAVRHRRFVSMPSRRLLSVSHHLADSVVLLAEAIERLGAGEE